ncbi:protein GrpE isoform X2 [Populus alba x Populus x berolinensis]|uniref:GrpE protein homolog n=2 Tax=Populus alba TaxID=43335 RepID=A0A4U5MYI2_POPAL|nr:protein GrpE isoform X2 [Populus alba]KAJ6884148.1 protein GrpE isoform X2 [Populus alba x Populus x berolinensis]TKR75071.1 co-chaperone grpE family protein [Populus alba]
MATVIKTPPFSAPRIINNSSISLKYANPLCLSFSHNSNRSIPNFSVTKNSLRFPTKPSLRFVKFVPFSSQGETETTETEETIQEPEIEDSSDGAVEVEDAASSEEVADAEDTSSVVMASLRSYKEALASNDESIIAEIEAYLKSIEDEKIDNERKVASLTEELSIEKERVLRISADFDNFRKRTERERLSLVTNAQGEVVENLLSVLDNFERAKTQIKTATEGEEKINNSYQNIYKQFMEILVSLGVVPVETIGKPFDPMLHEAIMREDSDEFEEGTVLEEYRKGFKLGDRLLRPSMVKVSAGPGPVKPEQVEESQEEAEATSGTSEGGSAEEESA